jgi:hypothetical protein
VVVKGLPAERRARVFAGLQALWTSPFGSARTPPGLGEPIAEVPESGAVVLERVDGVPAGRRGHLEQTAAHVPEIALLLADLHGSGVRLPRTRSALDVARAVDRVIEERAPAVVLAELREIARRLRVLAPARSSSPPATGTSRPGTCSWPRPDRD